MTPRTKQITFLLLAVVLVALLLLSASLSHLQLQGGTPFPGSASNQSASRGDSILLQTESRALPVLEAIFAVLLLMLMIYVPARLIRLMNLRNALGLVLAIVVLLSLIIILPRVLPGRPAVFADDSSVPASPPLFVYPVSPLGKPPPAFAWLAAGGLLLGICLFTVQLLKRPTKPMDTVDTLSQEAEEALHALEAGRDFSNVIIRCYLQMGEVLRAERRVERQHSMTAREFQDWLELKGIPPGPVHQLTSLFEKARYSKEQIDNRDEETGTECLKQIIQYCRKEDADHK